MALIDDLLAAILPLTQAYTKTLTVNNNISSSGGSIYYEIEGDEPEHMCLWTGVTNVTIPGGVDAIPLSLDPANGTEFYPTTAKYRIDFYDTIVSQPFNVTFNAVFIPVAVPE